MKKLSRSFQKGNVWVKTGWVAIITFALIVLWIVLDSLMFFLSTTVGTIGLLCISPFIALGIISLSIIKYPRVKDYNEYSNYTKKYL